MRRQNRRERRKRFADNVVDVIQLIRRDDIWRNGIEHVAERAEEDAVLEKERIEARSEIREIAGIIGSEFQRRHRAKESNVPDSRMITKNLETLPVNALDGHNPLENRLRFKDFQIRDCRGTAQRVSGIRISVEEGPATLLTEKRIVDFRPTCSRCQLQSTFSLPLRSHHQA